MKAYETPQSGRRRPSTRAEESRRAGATGHITRGSTALILTGLVLATVTPPTHGESGERTQGSEAPAPISVPFGSAAAAEVPEARGTAIRPILEGVMSPPEGVLVTVSGHPMRLAPGVTIRDQYNRIILPSALQRSVPVRFTLDHLGHIHRVRIMPQS